MTVVTLRPNGTVSSSGIAITGAASAHAALSDNSDSSFVTFDSVADTVALNSTDLTLPAGAVVKRTDLRLRFARVSTGWAGLEVEEGGTVYSAALPLSAPTTVSVQISAGGNLATPYSDSQLDALILAFHYANWSNPFHLYEVYLDVTHVAKPVVDVNGPTSPVGNTNRPTVTWADTLDSDGGAQTHYQVRVFTDAQYLAGGFDPASSTATDESGIQASTATLWQGSALLPDDTYRAYVRVAQTVNGSQHWSAWDYQQFTLSVALPAVPTLTLTAEHDDARILIEVNDNAGAATTDALEIQRSTDSGTTWEPVRLTTDTAGIVEAADATVYDIEAANGIETFYRARALHNYSGAYAASAWVTDSDTWTDPQTTWLKDPLDPSRNTTVRVASYSSYDQPARQGVHQPLGATYPVVISDTRGPVTGTLIVDTETSGERAALDVHIAGNRVLLLQLPAIADEPDRYIVLGDHTRTRPTDKAFSATRHDTLPWVEVDAPDGVVTEWPEGS